MSSFWGSGEYPGCSKCPTGRDLFVPTREPVGWVEVVKGRNQAHSAAWAVALPDSGRFGRYPWMGRARETSRQTGVWQRMSQDNAKLSQNKETCNSRGVLLT